MVRNALNVIQGTPLVTVEYILTFAQLIIKVECYKHVKVLKISFSARIDMKMSFGDMNFIFFFVSYQPD